MDSVISIMKRANIDLIIIDEEHRDILELIREVGLVDMIKVMFFSLQPLQRYGDLLKDGKAALSNQN